MEATRPLLGHTRYRRVRTNRYFFTARSNAFFGRLPIERLQRGITMEYIRKGRMRPWHLSKEQVLGAGITLNLDYNPRPVRLVGTVMDLHGTQSQLRGGIKVYARHEDTNVQLWVPFGNPKLKYEISATDAKSFDHYLAERDKWDEAWITGKARLS